MHEETLTIELNHGVVAAHLKQPFVRVKITFYKDGTCLIPQFTENKVHQFVIMWRWEWAEGNRLLKVATKPIGEWNYSNFYFSLPEEEVPDNFTAFLGFYLEKEFKKEFGFKDWK